MRFGRFSTAVVGGFAFCFASCFAWLCFAQTIMQPMAAVQDSSFGALVAKSRPGASMRLHVVGTPHSLLNPTRADLPAPIHDWRGCACVDNASRRLEATSLARDACPRLGGDRNPVPGLVTVDNFLGEMEQLKHLELLNSYQYFEYAGKDVQEHGAKGSFYIENPTTTVMPDLLANTSLKLVELGLVRVKPNYVLVNKYEPGRGIHPHVDDSFYDDGICGVTLSHGAVLDFFSEDNPQNCYSTLLPPGAVFCMQRQARYKWKHQMQPRLFDFWDGWVPRHTRVALTFRHLTADTQQAFDAGLRPQWRPFAHWQDLNLTLD